MIFKKPAVLTVLVLLTILEAALLVRFFSFTADDAYIVARYAENLVDGGGLVFNPGERINALTSPLHAFVNALLFYATGSTITANKVLAITAVLGVYGVALWHLRHRQADAVLFAALVLPSPLISLWTVGGLETPYLIALVTALVLLTRNCGNNMSPVSATAASVVMGLCFVTRYDSVPFLLPVMGYLLLENPRRATCLILPGACLVLGWLGFAWWYYHDILPTSFHTKTPRYTMRGMCWNAIYMAQLFVFSGLVVVIPATILRSLGISRAGRKQMGDYLRRSWWLLAGIGLVLVYGLSAATIHMLFGYRLLVPYLPATVLASLELRQVVRAASERKAAPPGKLLLLPVVLLVGLHTVLAWAIEFRTLNPGMVGELRREARRNYVQHFTRVLETAAVQIRSHWQQQPDANHRLPRIHTFAAGILPYHYRDAYIFEPLVSYRRQRPPWVLPEGASPFLTPTALSADYVHVLAPRLGTVQSQLPRPASNFELISSHTIVFDGRQEQFLVFFQRNPLPNCLPPLIDGEWSAPSVPARP